MKAKVKQYIDSVLPCNWKTELRIIGSTNRRQAGLSWIEMASPLQFLGHMDSLVKFYIWSVPKIPYPHVSFFIILIWFLGFIVFYTPSRHRNCRALNNSTISPKKEKVQQMKVLFNFTDEFSILYAFFL